MGGLGGPRPPHKRGVGWGGGGDGEARNHHQGQLPLVATVGRRRRACGLGDLGPASTRTAAVGRQPGGGPADDSGPLLAAVWA